MSTLLLAAVGSSRGKTSITLSANHLVAVVLTGQHLERWLNSTTSKTKNQMEGRLLLDIVVAQRATVLELLSGKDKSLLVWGDSLLVLNLGLHVINGVGRFDIKGDGLTS